MQIHGSRSPPPSVPTHQFWYRGNFLSELHRIDSIRYQHGLARAKLIVQCMIPTFCYRQHTMNDALFGLLVYRSAPGAGRCIREISASGARILKLGSSAISGLSSATCDCINGCWFPGCLWQQDISASGLVVWRWMVWNLISFLGFVITPELVLLLDPRFLWQLRIHHACPSIETLVACCHVRSVAWFLRYLCCGFQGLRLRDTEDGVRTPRPTRYTWR